MPQHSTQGTPEGNPRFLRSSQKGAKLLGEGLGFCMQGSIGGHVGQEDFTLLRQESQPLAEAKMEDAGNPPGGGGGGIFAYQECGIKGW